MVNCIGKSAALSRSIRALILNGTIVNSPARFLGSCMIWSSKQRSYKQQTDLRRLIEQATQACVQCKEFAPRPFRFWASLPDDYVVLNDVVKIDLEWLDRDSIFHVLNIHITFQNAAFVTDKILEGLWHIFTKCKFKIDLDMPTVLLVDQEASFNSEQFMAASESIWVTLQ